MLDLEVRHLRLVVSIAEEGGLTRAASRLHLTQSALSHQLREVEERLGTALYHRMNRKLVMTEAGRQLLTSARAVLDRLKQTEDEIRGMSEGRAGSLRISTQCYTCYHWLPPMLKSFQERFPGVNVQINLEATRRPLDALISGKLDLAIVTGPVQDTRLDAHFLFQDEMVAVMSRDHRLAGRAFLRAEDFPGERLFVYSLPTAEYPKDQVYVIQKVLNPAGVVPGQVLEVRLTEAMIEMVAAGMGISVLAGWAAAPYVKSRKLCAVPVTRGGLQREWYAAILQSRPQRLHLLEFIRLMREGCGGLSTRAKRR